jgi:hypothetical protein
MCDFVNLPTKNTTQYPVLSTLFCPSWVEFRKSAKFGICPRKKCLPRGLRPNRQKFGPKNDITSEKTKYRVFQNQEKRQILREVPVGKIRFARETQKNSICAIPDKETAADLEWKKRSLSAPARQKFRILCSRAEQER